MLQNNTTARAFFGALELFALAESLGGVESTANHSATMSHAFLTPEERAALVSEPRYTQRERTLNTEVRVGAERPHLYSQ